MNSIKLNHISNVWKDSTKSKQYPPTYVMWMLTNVEWNQMKRYKFIIFNVVGAAAATTIVVVVSVLLFSQFDFRFILFCCCHMLKLDLVLPVCAPSIYQSKTRQSKRYRWFFFVFCFPTNLCFSHSLLSSSIRIYLYDCRYILVIRFSTSFHCYHSLGPFQRFGICMQTFVQNSHRNSFTCVSKVLMTFFCTESIHL